MIAVLLGILAAVVVFFAAKKGIKYVLDRAASAVGEAEHHSSSVDPWDGNQP